MKHTKFLAILPVAILVVVIGMYAPSNAYAKGGSTPVWTTGPTSLACTFADPLTASWDTQGSKYSVQVTAHYEAAPDQVFSFSSATNSFSTPLSSLISGVDSSSPTGADIAVKSLSTPGKSQNNAFSTASCISIS